MDHLCHLWLVFVMLSRLFIAALWSPAGKGLTLGSCLRYLIVILSISHVVFGPGVVLIVLIPDLCRLSYFVTPYGGTTLFQKNL